MNVKSTLIRLCAAILAMILTIGLHSAIAEELIFQEGVGHGVAHSADSERSDRSF
jgi:hypothetical protein